MSTKTTQPKGNRALAKLALGGTFTTIEVLAALQLDGWLSLALWAIAAWNVGVTLLVIIGLAAIAEEHLSEDRA